MDRLLAQVLFAIIAASSQAHSENFRDLLVGAEQEQINLYRQLKISQGEAASPRPVPRRKLQRPPKPEGSDFQIRLVPKRIHKRTFVAKSSPK